MKRLAKRVLQSVLGPAIRWFALHFDRLDEGLRTIGGSVSGVGQGQAELVGLTQAHLDQQRSSEALVGRSLARQSVLLESIDERQAELTQHLESLQESVRLPILGDADLEMSQLDQRGSDYLNRATGWRGFSARAGIFVNEPITYRFGPGSVQVLNINERIAELPFVFGEVARVPPPARVLDVGSSESPVAAGLASLGYDVVAADPRGYAFSHPNLSVVAEEAQNLPDSDPFDLVVLLSTIEHVGVGHYIDSVDDTADFVVMERVAQLSRPGTRLVLTTPFGQAAQDEVQRIYDPERLEKLLSGWTVETVRILERASDTEWNVVRDAIELPPGDEFRVAMVSAVLGG